MQPDNLMRDRIVDIFVMCREKHPKYFSRLWRAVKSSNRFSYPTSRQQKVKPTDPQTFNYFFKDPDMKAKVLFRVPLKTQPLKQVKLYRTEYFWVDHEIFGGELIIFSRDVFDQKSAVPR